MHTDHTEPQEIELKLTLAPGDAARLAEHPLLRQYAAAPPHTEQLLSTYFDTPDRHLLHHGASLRVRQLEHGCLQTLKDAAHGKAGFFRRAELEQRVDGPGVDLAALRASIGKHSRWRKVLDGQALQDALQPLFDTRVSRSTWELRLPDGAEIEFALDRGSIECGASREELCEAELELKTGAPAALHSLALALLAEVPMQLSTDSKSERGDALCDGGQAQSAPVKFGGLALAPRMSVEDAFRHIVEACLAQVRGNAGGVVRGTDPEYVHQMRVGLRRLHSAFGLFQDLIALPAELDTELGWLGGELGAARDWEVLAHGTLAGIDEAEALPRAAADIATERRAQAAAAVQSPRHTRLMLSLERWLLEARWRDQMPQWKCARLASPLHRFAGKQLARSQRRLLKRGAKLRGADARGRHRVRIAAKKARYAMEFFEPLYPQRQVRHYVGALSGLQDELGRLNDAAVADHLLLELAGTRTELAPAAGFARGYLASTVEHAGPGLRKQWKRFSKLSLPRDAR